MTALRMRPQDFEERSRTRATFRQAGMALFRLKPSVVESLRKQKYLYSLWSSTLFVGVVWLTDWRVVLDYVPWINGKFKKDE